jgi:hypothetical protein
MRKRKADVTTTTLTQPDTLWRPRRRWQKAFLEALRNSANVRWACLQVSITRQSAYEYREKHARFAAQWDEALADAIDLLEAEAWRRATTGTIKPTFYKGVMVVDKQGQPIGVPECSDGLLTLLLKAHRPERFRERFEHTGANGAPLGPATVTIFLPDNGRDTAPAPAGPPNSVSE